jgi:tetratricopeptide (TPR) repeat protein
MAATVHAVSDAPGANPIGPATVPQSLFENSLYPTPNPVDASFNLMMTGNVDGGKHFRGYLPYNSTSDLMIDVGSSYIDAFMRYTQVPAGTDVAVSGYSPFYSQTASVTGMVPGQEYVINPALSQMGMGPEFKQIGGSEQMLVKMDDISLLGDLSDKADVEVLRTMPMDIPDDIQDVVSTDLRMQGLDVLNTERATGPGTEPESMDEEGVGVSQDLSLIRHAGREPVREEARAQAFEKENDDIIRIDDDVGLVNDVFEQTVSLGIDTDRGDTSVTDMNDGDSGRSTMMYLQERLSDHTWNHDTPVLQRDSEEVPLMPSGLPPAEAKTSVSGIKEVDFSSFKIYSQTQFSKFIIKAEHHLRSGNRGQALDAYTMADIYYPGDPLVDLGKSHALFALGEFASSALFLSRALEGLPAYGRVRLDLAGLLGGEQRLAEYIKQAEEELKKSSSVDLYIVLGYVYYQIGDLDSARGAIETAMESRPDCPAVKVMREVIQDAYDAL